jgi:EAL and modified HD-GYP domain-containing signal transduction protein
MKFHTARQPILDRKKNLYAYELLFREGEDNVFPDIDEDMATSRMIGGLFSSMGLEEIVQNKPAFINLTHHALLSGIAKLLPQDQVVIEILETVKPGKRLLQACKELFEQGYTLALDDYEHKPVWKHFYPFIRVIKIDFLATSKDDILDIIDDIKPYPHIELLAEKVETHQHYQEAMEMGFTYFQGFFFNKPEMIKGEVLSSFQSVLTQLMQEICSPDPDISKLTELFESDVNLSYKLLRYAQSPIFKRREEINSIRKALLTLGNEEIKRLVSVLAASNFSNNKPVELITQALNRAMLCEQVASFYGNRDIPSAAFLAGLMSLLGALMDADLNSLLVELPLSEDIKFALSDNKGPIAPYLQLSIAMESADWAKVDSLVVEHGWDLEKVESAYQRAINWSTQQILMMDDE